MGIEPLFALLFESALAVLAAIVAPRAKPIAIVFGIVGFLMVPWFAGPVPLLRGLAALVGFVNLLRIVDVVRIGDPWSPMRRVLHVVSFVDSRTLRRAPLHFDVVSIGRGLLWAALGAAGYWAIQTRHHPLRLLAGLVFVYAAIESAYSFFAAVYRALGFVPPRLHVLPLASLSIGELWGTRWARPISTWLRETCFRPLARRGHPMLGILLGFGVARWRRPARRAWTVTLMVASSPLFVEPVLRTLAR